MTSDTTPEPQEPITEAGRWAQRLYEDLAYAPPEMWLWRITLRFEEAIEEVEARTAGPPDIDVGRLADGIAYALARAEKPTWKETAHAYALRLAPLVIESGWLASSDTTPR